MVSKANNIWSFVLFVSVIFIPGLSQSATCQYGTISNTTTCTVTGDDFDVQYDLADTGLYGDARIINSSVYFFPTGFSATSSNGAGNVNTSSTVSFDLIITNAAVAIDELHLTERGRYELNGVGASVNHAGNLDVIDFSNGDFLADSIAPVDPLNINDGAIHNWTANGDIDLTASAGHFTSTTIANIMITNSLSATTLSAGEFASIEKVLGQQVVALGVNVTPPPLPEVPVPPAIYLFVSGFLGLLGVAKRKKANS